MAYEMMVGLTVADDAAYTRYREAMAPILSAHGGGFRYDFRIGEVLRTAAEHPINRVFAIYFRDRANQEAFFSNPEYLAVKAAHFEGAVDGTTILAEYERE